MTEQGFDFYLVDWGVFGPEDNEPHGGGRGDEDPAAAGPEGARVVRGVGDVGARLLHGRAAVGVLRWPAPRVSRQELHRHGGAHRLLARSACSGSGSMRRYFDVDKYVDTLGSIPADMVKLGFKLLKPTMDLSTNMNLWWNLWNPEYVAGFNALNKWANEYLPFPGEFFRQWVKEFYQQNRLYQGELMMGGPPGAAREHPLSGARGGRQGRQHRPAGLREAADRRRVEHGQGIRGAPGRPHLAHRGTRRVGALLAQGRELARGAVVRRRRDDGRQFGHPAALRSVEEAGGRRARQAWLKMLGQGQAARSAGFLAAVHGSGHGRRGRKS